MVETNVFNPVITRVLQKYDDDGILHPVAYLSRNHSPVEIYYKIYKKELLIIVNAFKE
jgi:hypothetical protein